MATFRRKRSRKYRNKNTRRKSRNARKSNIKRRGKKSLRGGGILSSLFGKKTPQTTPPSKALTPEEKKELIKTIDDYITTIEEKKAKLLDIQHIPVPQQGTISDDDEFQALRDENTRGNIVNNYNLDSIRYFKSLKKDLETVSTDVINILSQVYAIDPNAIKNDKDIAQLLPEVIYDKISVSFYALYPRPAEYRDIVTLSQAKKFNDFIINIYDKNITLLEYLKRYLA